MKAQRQAKIIEIITRQKIETQEQLQLALNENGFPCTQTTISRDIRDLHIIKELGKHGEYRYVPANRDNTVTVSERFQSIFRDCVISIDFAQNIVVLKTLPGMASAACLAIDSMQLIEVVGTLAGDDTGLVIMRDHIAANAFCSQMEAMVNVYPMQRGES